VKFLDRRVAEMRKEADQSAHRLREFEEKYKIIDLDPRAKPWSPRWPRFRSQEISKELQLSYIEYVLSS